MNNLNIYTDGGSRGNPGPAACAFVLQDDSGRILHQSAFLLGITTNNIAEYQGLKAALRHLLDHPSDYALFSHYRFHLDSELVVRQVNGQYKVKDSNIKAHFLEIRELLSRIGKSYQLQHVPRSSNKIADQLLNLELDEQKPKS